MSKFDALMMAMIAVCLLILVGLVIFVIVAVLSVMKPIGWVFIGVTLLVTLILWVGIYQYDKHF